MKKIGEYLFYSLAAAICGHIPFAPADELSDTAKLYKIQCAQCHGEQALGNEMMSAPRLAGQQKTYLQEQLDLFNTSKRGTHPNDTNGMTMRLIAESLDKEQIEQVSIFLSNLPYNQTGAHLETEGRAIYTSTCAACHAYDASGSSALLTPNLRILGRWYIKNQLDAYEKGWRGAEESSSTRSKSMRAIVTQLDKEERKLVLDFLLPQ